MNRSRSFTLIELMVVIAIIAILATLLFPEIFRTRERGRQRQAMADACGIVTAVKMYQAEHGRWPNQTQAATDTTYFADNYRVVNLLRIPASNDRNRLYFAVETNRLDDIGNFVDPWGMPYIICMDENHDGRLDVSFSNVVYSNQFTHEISTNSINESNLTVIGVAAVSIGGADMIKSSDKIK